MKHERKARILAETRNRKQAETGRKPVIMADMVFHEDPAPVPVLPEITETDLNFARSLCDQYDKISLDELCQVIRSARYEMTEIQEGYKAHTIKINEYLKEKHQGIEHIRGIKSIPDKVKKNVKKEMNERLNYIVFMKIWRFFNNSELLNDHKKIATGKTLKYFGLFDLDKPLPESYNNEDQYLKDRIKKLVNRLK